jgi:hypothetical protein
MNQPLYRQEKEMLHFTLKYGAATPFSILSILPFTVM